ncbi:MAG TPA: hypothetical protein VG096_18365 [Bryobacteraceae bacterium]|jgi:hypothetical protein|nr:hypothetical protein [Bryobacteraceae bacterium]
MNLAKYTAPLLLLTLSALPSLRADSSIVVSHDEWMFSNGELGVDDDTQFAKSIASFLTGGSGNILILSNNFGLDGSNLQNLLTTSGYSVTESTVVPVSLSGFNAVFVGGMAVNNALLTSYVNGGGSVFLEAGTGSFGTAAAEAAAWNPFLNAFDLGLANNFNGICCDTNVSPFHSQPPYGAALFSGVNTVFANNGNDVSILGINPSVQVFNDANANGLYAAERIASVPEPSSVVVLAGFLLALGLTLRKRAARNAA